MNACRYSELQDEVVRLRSRVDAGQDSRRNDTANNEVDRTNDASIELSTSPGIVNDDPSVQSALPMQASQTLLSALPSTSGALGTNNHLDPLTQRTRPRHSTTEEDIVDSHAVRCGGHLQGDLRPRHLHAPVTAVNAMTPASTSTGCELGPSSASLPDRIVANSLTHDPELMWSQKDAVTTVFGTEDLPRMLFAWSAV